MSKLQACLNGSRSRADRPALPVTASELAIEAAKAANVGASEVHLHAKDPAGDDSLLAVHVDAAVTAVRELTPGLRIGVTTGEWAMPDPEQRVQAVRSWSELPDFASVNWHEPGAEQVAAALLERGIGVEAGIWGRDVVHLWSRSRLRDQCMRVLVELTDVGRQAARGIAADLVMAVRSVEPDVEILLHGEDDSAWATVALAFGQGLATRVGLEDMLTRPDGTPAADSAQLVSDALTLFA